MGKSRPIGESISVTELIECIACVMDGIAVEDNERRLTVEKSLDFPEGLHLQRKIKVFTCDRPNPKLETRTCGISSRKGITIFFIRRARHDRDLCEGIRNPDGLRRI